MGRLNYTNRKCDPNKLGQILSKDLAKRIPPASGSKAALRDPVVEIDVSSKSLTDDGCAELASALVDSINFEQGKVVKLEELCLRDNQLSVSSLGHLSTVIELSRHDLRDLDLSNNKISISTEAEAATWEHFLLSFSQCYVLRRLDLSGNALGAKGFEILAKVYSHETPVDFSSLDIREAVDQGGDSPARHDFAVITNLELRARNMTIASGYEGIGSNEDEEPRSAAHKSKGSRHGHKSPEKSIPLPCPTDQVTHYATTHGLRSIPYLVFSDCSMDEACALHLSYVLTSHHVPERLLLRVPPAKAGTHTHQLAAYDNESKCRGIVYLPNSSLNAAALKVLEMSEVARTELLVASASGEESETTQEREGLNGMSQRSSEPYTSPTATVTHRRRTSAATNLELGYQDPTEIIIADLDRARSKIQGSVLQDNGSRSNDLWRTSLRMLSMCRYIQPQSIINTPTLIPPLTKAKTLVAKALEVTEITPTTPQRPRTYSQALWPKNANQPMTLRSDHVRKIMSIPSAPTVPPAPVIFKTDSLKARLPELRKDYRSTLPCGLPEEAWWRILGFAAGAEGILSEAQQRSVLIYAMDRGTLKKENESLGLKEAVQIWRILDGMACLAYEMQD